MKHGYLDSKPPLEPKWQRRAKYEAERHGRRAMKEKISAVTWRSALYGDDYKAIRKLSSQAFIIPILFLLLISSGALASITDIKKEWLELLMAPFLLYVYFLYLTSPVLIILDIIAFVMSIKISLHNYEGKAKKVAFVFLIFHVVFFIFMGCLLYPVVYALFFGEKYHAWAS